MALNAPAEFPGFREYMEYVRTRLKALSELTTTVGGIVGLPAGTTDQTVRYNGTDWVATSVLSVSATGVTANGTLTATGATTLQTTLGVTGITTHSNTSRVTLGTITTDVLLRDDSVTWNEGSTIFRGWRLNMSHTASNPTSKLIDVQLAGISKFAVGNPTSSSSPLVTIQGGATHQVALSLQANFGASASNLLVLDASGGSNDTSQLILGRLDSATQFSITRRGQFGIFGGSDLSVGCRIGGGNSAVFGAGVGSPVVLQIGALFDSDDTAITLLETGGLSGAGTYTTINVYAIRVLGFLKGASQTITNWYGIRVETGPVAGTKWSGWFAENVNVGGDLVVGGSISGGTLSYGLDALNDVVISSPMNGEVLTFNGTNWVNAASGGVAALDDLTDVIITTPAAGHFLRHNGTNWVNQLGVAEADIIDGTILARVANNETITGLWTFSGQITSTVVTGTAPLVIASTTLVGNLNADLLDGQHGAYYLDSANFTGTNWTDLTDGGETTLHTHATSGITSGTFVDARIAASNVTQHQAALTILETQITDGTLLARVGSAETITGAWTWNEVLTITPDVGGKGLVITGVIQTTNQPLLDLAQTWNAGAVAFTAIKLAITNTASAAGSAILSATLGGGTVWGISSTGSFGVFGGANDAIALRVGGAGSGPTLINLTSTGLEMDVRASDAVTTAHRQIYTRGLGASGTPTYTTVAVYGIYVDQYQRSANQTITTHYGIYIATGPTAGTRYAIYTNTGTVRFGDTVNIASGVLQMAGTQVVTTRQTGYTAMTGTADRGTAYATSTITLQQLAERVKALQDDLTTHGLIGV